MLIRLNITRLVFCLMLIYITSPSALSQQIIKNFTVDDGLLSSEVYDAHADRDGYIWFCTDRGVSRYNGYEFENFTTSDGLTDYTIFKVFEDKDHNLWFTCFNGSLTIFDYKTKKFRPFKLNKELKSKIGSYNWVEAINFKGEDVYFFSYRYKKGKFKFNLKTESLEAVQDNKSDKYFIGDKIGNRQLITYRGPEANLLADYFTIHLENKDLDDQLLNSIKIYFDSQILPLKLRSNNVLKIQSLKYSGNLRLFNKIDKLEVSVNEKVTKILDLASSNTEVDSEGNIWVTTVNNGVYLMSNNGIEMFPMVKKLRPAEKITAIETFEGIPFLGTSFGSVIQVENQHHILNSSTPLGRINFFSKINGATYIINNEDKSLVTSKDNKLVVRTSSIQEKKELTEIPYLVLDIKNEKRFHIRPGSFKVTQNNVKIFEKFQRLSHAVTTNRNEVYYSTPSELFKVSNYNFNRPQNLTKHFGLKNLTVRRMLYVKGSTLIMATVGAGVFIAKNDSLVLKIDKKNGLVSDLINVIYFDENKNRLWCGTNRGISIIDFSVFGKKYIVKSIQNITRLNGLPNGFVMDITSSENKVWVAFAKDVVSIPKNYQEKNVAAPKLSFILLIQNDKNYLNQTPKFSHNENDIHIEYVAMSLKKPVNARFYRYRLKHSNSKLEKWVETDERELTFMNLDAGEYNFQVSARSENSSWGTPGELHFTITPYFLDRWWVRVIIISLLILLAYTLIRSQIYKIQRENQKKLELQSLQHSNQKLELASLRGQMNPHFIFNVLNSIQKNILTGEKWQANNLLTRFSKLIRSSLEYSRTDFITIQKEIEFLENYLEIEKQRSPDKFDFIINTNLVSNETESLMPTLLIQPICENAIKHAFADKKGLLEIDISQLDEDFILVTVTDDGIGFKNSKQKDDTFKNSLGLDIVKSRLEIFKTHGIQSELKIESPIKENNTGTKITLYIPCK